MEGVELVEAGDDLPGAEEDLGAGLGKSAATAILCGATGQADHLSQDGGHE